MSNIRILTEDQAMEIAESAAAIALKNLLESQGFQLVKTDNPTQEEEALCTVDDIAKHTNMHPGSVRRMVREGSLPHYRAGKKILLRKSEVDKALARSRGQRRK